MRESRRAWGEQPAWRVLVACGIVVAAVVILATSASHRHPAEAHHQAVRSRPVVLAPTPATTTPLAPATTSTSTSPTQPKGSKRSGASRRVASQDPQDRAGSPAARRAKRALETHRALQHVPYRHGDVRITLTGALRDGKAVLTVTAPTLKDAKVGYRRFLARYHDTGRAYQPKYTLERRGRRG